MKSHAVADKAPKASASAGEKAVALAPPDYGMEFVDRGMPVLAPVQRREMPEDPEPLEEEELPEGTEVVQAKAQPASGRTGIPAPNRTGMPDRLKAGVESLSGMDLSGVRVTFNSAAPARLNAFAYTQGDDIHLAPGQEQHLPHEAWHAVQQRQGRVRATMQAKGVAINDDSALEREADVMGRRASLMPSASFPGANQTGRPVGTDRSPRPIGVWPVQRRMGIEAEMSVPAPLDGAAATAEDRIRSFLGGSQNPGQQIQAPANGFEIETDHDQLGTEIAGVRRAVNVILANGGVHPQIALTTAGAKVANMEYKSDPYDEETGAGRAQLLATVDAMVVDMTANYNAAIAGQFVLGGYRIGMPVDQDWDDFANAVGIGLPAIRAMRDAIRGRIRPGLYMQVTAGILPKKIGKLMTQAAGNRTVASLRETLFHDADAMERLLTSGAAATAWTVLAQTAGLTRDQRRSNSLHGYLSLIIAYLYGNYIFWLGNTVAKNLTPFLSKVPLNEVQLELDTSKRPDQMLAATRLNLQNQIDAAVVARVAQQDVAAFWPAGGGVHTGGPLGDWQGVWLPGLLEGHNVGGADAFSAAQLAGRTLDPEDHARSKRIAPGPGRVARNVGGHEVGGVIPLEFRHIEQRPTPALLRAFVNKMIKFVRKVNGWW